MEQDMGPLMGRLTIRRMYCSTCTEIIRTSRYASFQGYAWHLACLRCDECGMDLSQATDGNIKDGKVFCPEDFFKRHAGCPPCSTCRKEISSKDDIMIVDIRVFHTGCFFCSVCKINIAPKQLYGINELSELFCSSHYEPVIDSTTSKVKQDESAGIHENSDMAEPAMASAVGTSIGGSRGGKRGEGRISGGRVFFTKEQVKIFETSFTNSPSPSSADFEKMCKETGLKKQRIKNWFQNRRAKGKARRLGGKGRGTVERGRRRKGKNDVGPTTSSRPAERAAVQDTAEPGLIGFVNQLDNSQRCPVFYEDRRFNVIHQADDLVDTILAMNECDNLGASSTETHVGLSEGAGLKEVDALKSDVSIPINGRNNINNHPLAGLPTRRRPVTSTKGDPTWDVHPGPANTGLCHVVKSAGDLLSQACVVAEINTLATSPKVYVENNEYMAVIENSADTHAAADTNFNCEI